MSFQKFCDAIKDEQKITAEKSLLLTYTNTKNEAFSISPENIRLFLVFVADNFESVYGSWSEIPSRKNKINKYEEKSYREIYKSAGADDLKTISSAGRSQTKALTTLITKLISFLTDSPYVSAEENTFLEKETIQLALNNWDKLTVGKTNDRRVLDVKSIQEDFRLWMIKAGLSERTAKSYSGLGISFSDKYIRTIGFKNTSFYELTPENILKGIELLKGVTEWRVANDSGNSMYSSACKKLVEYFHSQKVDVYLSKPFLLLAGISGTGKTRFVREQAKASGSIEETYCLVSVRPDWHEPSDLLGYISRLGERPQYIATDVLRFIVQAWKEIIDSIKYDKGIASDWRGKSLDKIKPFWLCLDEMNLAPVEQYFSDYLSVLETRSWYGKEQLDEYNSENGTNLEYLYHCDPLLKSELIKSLDNDDSKRQSSNDLASALGLDLSEALDNDIWQYFYHNGIGIPFNLIFAGTVNMDETTHGFSRKVIDRALSFDFGEFFPNDFDHFYSPVTEPKTLSYPIWSDARQHLSDLPSVDSGGAKSIEFLKSVNGILKNTPFELAFRALNELLLAVISTNPQDDLELHAVWDDFLMCKVLPRIEGDSDKLGNEPSLLEDLTALLRTQFADFWDKQDDAVDARPDLYQEKITKDDDKVVRIACRSKAKLEWMQERLVKSTFTSFWP